MKTENLRDKKMSPRFTNTVTCHCIARDGLSGAGGLGLLSKTCEETN